jgi:mono/diheme cytochrome c family protein
MNSWIKLAGIALLGLVAVAAITIVTAAQLGERKSNRHVDVAVAPLVTRGQVVSVERGRYLYLSRGCGECHGVDGAGKDVVNDGKGMHIHAPNLTTGIGSVVKTYQEIDWVRAVRHGVKPDGRPAMVMPSEDYNRLTDGDMASLVSFVQSLPPANGTGSVMQLTTLVKALYAFGVVRDAAERIDHTLPPSEPVPEAVTVRHGAYVANTCIGCHGTGLSGGKVPGAPPEWPAAANLTPGEGSAMTAYPTSAVFAAMFRNGKRPDGSSISKVMPFPALGAMSDVDVQALHLYLKSLPPRKFGSR